ncbi:MAG: hypothetical protein WKG06_18570 [Segetibacter sp.]
MLLLVTKTHNIKMNNQPTAILFLADGTVYYGKAFGKKAQPQVKYVSIPA